MRIHHALVTALAVAAFTGAGVIAQQGGKDAAAENIRKALPGKAFAEPAEKRKLLVFSVTNGFRHKSIPVGHTALAMLGDSTGAFEAVVSDDLANFESDRIDEFDAICFLNTTGEVFMPRFGKDGPKLADLPGAERKEITARSERLRGNLMRFIRGGKGFIGIHSATDTLYGWPEYGEMINGYFDGHPWNSRTPVSIKVEAGREDHPLVKHLGGRNLEFQEEIYQLKAPYDSGKVHMLLRLDTDQSPMDLKGIKREDKDFGVAWIRPWGEGRVFYCSLGHNDHIYWNPDVLKHYLGGIQWALGDLEMPVE